MFGLTTLEIILGLLAIPTILKIGAMGFFFTIEFIGAILHKAGWRM